MYYASWSHVQARPGSKGSHKFCVHEIICFTTATNPILLPCVYLGARFPSHSSFRYTEGRHGLYDLLQTIVSENMMMIFSYLIVPSFTYPSCLPRPLKHRLLPPHSFTIHTTYCPRAQGVSKNPLMKEGERELDAVISRLAPLSLLALL